MKKTMKKIMIDLDDTIVQNRYLDIYNKFANTNYTSEDLAGFYVESLLNEKEQEDFKLYLREHPDIYENSVLIEHAVEVIEKLNEKYEVFICSAYVNKHDLEYSARILDQKFKYVRKVLPFINPNNIMFAGRKDIVMCDIKIDDKVKNMKGYGEIKLLFSQGHNSSFTDEDIEKYNAKRVKDWYEIEDILLGSD